ncbi:MAG: hypothetical protein J6M56_07140 [Clostridia bacterium]|nr:hypothetical protein [Clostridia bacterium]
MGSEIRLHRHFHGIPQLIQRLGQAMGNADGAEKADQKHRSGDDQKDDFCACEGAEQILLRCKYEELPVHVAADIAADRVQPGVLHLDFLQFLRPGNDHFPDFRVLQNPLYKGILDIGNHLSVSVDNQLVSHDFPEREILKDILFIQQNHDINLFSYGQASVCDHHGDHAAALLIEYILHAPAPVNHGWLLDLIEKRLNVFPEIVFLSQRFVRQRKIHSLRRHCENLFDIGIPFCPIAEKLRKEGNPFRRVIALGLIVELCLDFAVLGIGQQRQNMGLHILHFPVQRLAIARQQLHRSAGIGRFDLLLRKIDDIYRTQTADERNGNAA